MAKEKRDPYEITPDDGKKLENESRGKAKGVPCPQNNASLSERCHACEKLKPLWNYPEGSPQRKVAGDKKATVSYWLNFILPHNREKAIILEIGKKVGDSIIRNLKDPTKGWKNIANPQEGKGFEVIFTKFQGDGYPAYEISAVPEKTDWAISKSVLDNLPDLSQENIIKMLSNNELDPDNYMHVNSIKMDETLRGRICPSWEGIGSKKFMQYLFRHWGVTEDEVQGRVPMAGVETAEQANFTSDDDSPTVFDTDVAPFEPEPEFTSNEFGETPSAGGEKDEPCLGSKELYDKDDAVCQECWQFKKCSKLVMKG